MSRENRSRTVASDAAGDSWKASGISAPTQNAIAVACRNTAGRVSQCGAASAAWPLAASARPTPSNASAESGRTPAFHGTLMETIATSSASNAAVTVFP